MVLGKIGQREDVGIYRMAFTDEDLQARRWLIGQLESAGIPARMDGAANVLGTLNAQSPEKTLLIGSHLDTVPCAGALDGALGVMIGLEVLQRLQEEKVPLNRPVELVAFSDEEGRFGGMFGSQAFCGMISPKTLQASVDLNGVVLADAMRAQGFDPIKALEAQRDPEDIYAYLELHIEQGPVLDHLGKPIGVVNEITGLFRWTARLLGSSNHAGTTPMNMRQDAFMGLADFAHEIPRVLDEIGTEHSRATIGKVALWPGSANTVPSRVEFSLDVRDTSAAVLGELDGMFGQVLSAIARRRGLKFEFDRVSLIDPVCCDPVLVEKLVAVAKRTGLDFHTMPSGAAHDAQMLAQKVPAAMIFLPSKSGVSHSPEEWTLWPDIQTGANLMLETALDLSTGRAQRLSIKPSSPEKTQ